MIPWCLPEVTLSPQVRPVPAQPQYQAVRQQQQVKQQPLAPQPVLQPPQQILQSEVSDPDLVTSAPTQLCLQLICVLQVSDLDQGSSRQDHFTDSLSLDDIVSQIGGGEEGGEGEPRVVVR